MCTSGNGPIPSSKTVEVINQVHLPTLPHPFSLFSQAHKCKLVRLELESRLKCIGLHKRLKHNMCTSGNIPSSSSKVTIVKNEVHLPTLDSVNYLAKIQQTKNKPNANLVNQIDHTKLTSSPSRVSPTLSSLFPYPEMQTIQV